MAAIRAALDADHPVMHAGKETDAQYEALVRGALIAHGTYFDDPAWQPNAPVHEK